MKPQSKSIAAESVDDYRAWLLAELTRRKARNPLYSLRAFAKDLTISPAALSEALARKRHLSKRNLARVAERLALSPSESNRLVGKAGWRVPPAWEAREFALLQEDAFRMLGEWHYFALLSLAKLEDCQADESWLSQRLGVDPLVVREALERLQRLELVRARGNRLHRTTKSLTTLRDVPSATARKLQREQLEKAMQALDQVPVSQRDIGSVTMAVDSRRLARAKLRIMRFKRELARELEGGKPDQVYTLAVQLFPLTRLEASDE